MRWVKRIVVILAILSCALIVFFRLPVSSSFDSFKVKEASAIGIIGGADGPTAIYTASAIVSVYQIALFVVPVIIIIGVVLYKKR